jgi:DNA-binding NtrC family response regulator
LLQRSSDEPGSPPALCGGSSSGVDLGVPFKQAKQQLIDSFERRYISAMLKATRHNVSEAARRAQIDRMYLHKLITQHRLNED